MELCGGGGGWREIAYLPSYIVKWNLLKFLNVSFNLQNLLDPLCREIETDLRLQIHLHLQLDDRNPFKIGLKDLSQLLKLRPIRLFDRYINVKSELFL